MPDGYLPRITAYNARQIRDSVISPTQDSLDPEVWREHDDSYELAGDAQGFLVAAAAQFGRFGVIQGIYLHGSICSFQWESDSDMDLAIIMDPRSEELYGEAIASAMYIEGMDKMPGTQHTVDFFVMTAEDNDLDVQTGLYDVLENKWVRGPYSLHADVAKYMEQFRRLVRGLDIVGGELKRDLVDYDELEKLAPERLEELREELEHAVSRLNRESEILDKVYGKLHADRERAFSGNVTPEELAEWHSRQLLPGNVIYKLLERYHYLALMKAVHHVLAISGGHVEGSGEVGELEKALGMETEALLTEEPPPDDWQVAQTWYHGVPGTARAKSIAKFGIKPNRVSKYKDEFRPRRGMVYLTTDRDTAEGYALDDERLTDGDPYGYVFEIPGDRLKDVEPDEDIVHRMLMDIEEWEDFHREGLPPGPDWLIKQFDDRYQGAASISIAKDMLKRMTDEQKMEIMNWDEAAEFTRVAHRGAIMPTAVWRSDALLHGPWEKIKLSSLVSESLEEARKKPVHIGSYGAWIWPDGKFRPGGWGGRNDHVKEAERKYNDPNGFSIALGKGALRLKEYYNELNIELSAFSKPAVEKLYDLVQRVNPAEIDTFKFEWWDRHYPDHHIEELTKDEALEFLDKTIQRGEFRDREFSESFLLPTHHRAIHFYHGTTKERAEQIKQAGAILPVKFRGSEYVWLSDDWYMAYDKAAARADVRGEAQDIVVFRIDVPPGPERKKIHRTMTPAVYVYNGQIPVEWAKVERARTESLEENSPPRNILFLWTPDTGLLTKRWNEPVLFIGRDPSEHVSRVMEQKYVEIHAFLVRDYVIRKAGLKVGDVVLGVKENSLGEEEDRIFNRHVRGFFNPEVPESCVRFYQTWIEGDPYQRADQTTISQRTAKVWVHHCLDDIGHKFPEMRNNLVAMSGDMYPEPIQFESMEESFLPPIIFSTVHSWVRRITKAGEIKQDEGTDFRLFDVLGQRVIDELHDDLADVIQQMGFEPTDDLRGALVNTTITFLPGNGRDRVTGGTSDWWPTIKINLPSNRKIENLSGEIATVLYHEIVHGIRRVSRLSYSELGLPLTGNYLDSASERAAYAQQIASEYWDLLYRAKGKKPVEWEDTMTYKKFLVPWIKAKSPGAEAAIASILTMAKTEFQKMSMKGGRAYNPVFVGHQGITPYFGKYLQAEDSNSIRKSLWKTLHGLKVYIVDGSKVREKYNLDFDQGGNECAYDWVPAGEIWIDDNTDMGERKYILGHEMYERNLMLHGMDYEEAHKHATNYEKKLRMKDGHKVTAESVGHGFGMLSTEKIALMTNEYYRCLKDSAWGLDRHTDYMVSSDWVRPGSVVAKYGKGGTEPTPVEPPRLKVWVRWGFAPRGKGNQVVVLRASYTLPPINQIDVALATSALVTDEKNGRSFFDLEFDQSRAHAVLFEELDHWNTLAQGDENPEEIPSHRGDKISPGGEVRARGAHYRPWQEWVTILDQAHRLKSYGWDEKKVIGKLVGWFRLTKEIAKAAWDEAEQYQVEHLHEDEYYANKSGQKFWGDKAAGVLPIAKSTGRLLLSMRSSEVNEPNTWGVWGGRTDEEDPRDGALREFREECGYSGSVRLIPSTIFKAKGFSYHNYIGIVEEEFKPEMGWEVESYEWVTLDEALAAEPKHFGLKYLLGKAEAQIRKVVQQFKPSTRQQVEHAIDEKLGGDIPPVAQRTLFTRKVEIPSEYTPESIAEKMAKIPHDDDMDGYREAAAEDLGGEAEDSEVEKRAEELYKEDVMSSAEDALDNISDLSDPMNLYRMIMTKPNSPSHANKARTGIMTDHLGVCWAWDIDGAEAHWGHYSTGNREITLYAQVEAKYVDWEVTLLQNSDPYYREEKEIRLKENTPIRVTRIKVQNGPWRKVNLVGKA